MRRCEIKSIADKLAAIPEQSIVKSTYVYTNEPSSGRLLNVTSQLHGKGKIKTYHVFPGVEMSYISLLTDQATYSHVPDEWVLEINYSILGRIGWHMERGETIYLGPGDFSIHPRVLCANSTMNLPLGYYEGIMISLDLKTLETVPPPLLKGINICQEDLLHKFCSDQSLITLSHDPMIQSIFAPLLENLGPFHRPYSQLKLQELLLHLYRLPVLPIRQFSPYRIDQIETVKAVHDELLSNLDQRITIEELAERYLINVTTLKDIFKTVYGNSIGAFVREQRMEKAAELLRISDDSVMMIAQRVGFKSQSKFTVAFKDVFGTLPTAYRKAYYEAGNLKNI
ncbi:MAG: helix-turn-helix transcriptional regulator [Fastidiosipilaceae bacterium]|nr:helix-turn-helix transcriptional regulator [Clostridiaceae bacterium]